MAGISIGNQLDLRTRLPLDSRHLFHTIEEMVEFPDNFLPELFICQNEEEPDALFIFNKQNELDEKYGKWRLFKSGDKIEIATLEKLGIVSVLQDGGILLEDGRLYLENQENLKKITDEIINIITQINQEDIDSFHNHDNKSVLDTITSDKLSEIHTHDNKDILDGITEETLSNITHDNRDILDTINQEMLDKIHEHSNSEVLDSLTQELVEKINHENRNILDNITQDTIDSIHTHENKDIIDAITEEHINKITHDNRDVLDKLSEGEKGLLYDGKDISGVSVWSDITDKPFESVNSKDFEIVNDVLTIKNSGQTTQIATLPTANKDNKNMIYQYIGGDTDTYKNGYFYKCMLVDGIYKWVNVKVQPDLDIGNFITSKELETHASSNLHLTQAQRNKITNSALTSDIPTKLIDLKDDTEQVALLNKLGSNNGKLTYDGELVASGVELSAMDGNIIENLEDGLYATHQSLEEYAKTVNVISKSETRTEAAIDTTISNTHSHTNSDVLSKLDVSDGRLKYDGVDVANNIEVSKMTNNGIVMNEDGVYYDASKDHVHKNSVQLDKIGESNGEFTYNGKAIATKISKQDGNAISEMADGIYVSKTGVKISSDKGNKLATSANDDGLFVPESVYTASTDADNIVVIDATKRTIKVPKTKISTATDNAISDNNGLYVKKIEISDEPNNALVEVDGKLYVSEGSIVIGTQEDNQLQNTELGLYVPKQEVEISSTSGNIITKDANGKLFAKNYITTINTKSPNSNGAVTIDLDVVADGKTRKLLVYDTKNLGETYHGVSDKVVSSQWVNNNFANKLDILDKLGKNDDGKLTFNNIEVATSNVSLDPDAENIISITENGLLAKHQSLADYAKTKDITDNYITKKTIEETYIPYNGYTDKDTKKILGSQIKKKTIDYMDLTSVGELSGENLETKLLEHVRNSVIHNVSTLNSILINKDEFSGGTLTNFIIDSDGNLSLVVVSEKVDEETGETVKTYTTDKAVFESKIYDVGKSMPWVTYSHDGNYSAYLSSIGMYVRYGTTPIYNVDTWTEYQDVTDDKSLTFINSQYIQFKIHAQTADRYKNISFNFIQIFYGEDANTEIAQSRYRTLTDVAYPLLSARLDAMDDDLKEYDESDILLAIDEAVSAWNDLVYPENIEESG